MRLIFATHNKNKLIEIRQIMSDVASEIVGKDELGIDFEPEENGKSFAENSEIKATAIREYMKSHHMLANDDIIMADDSGLCVDWLHGGPGIFSSRYLGEDTSYAVKNQHIIDKLKYAEGDERAAHFTCDICAAFADGRVFHTEGIFPGIIAYKPAGENGFGYDPILYLPEFHKTSAELSAEEKNSISHRGKALREMRRLLQHIRESDAEISKRVAPLEDKPRRKRVLVVSDSHRKDDNLKKVIDMVRPIDIMIHLGDVEGSEDCLRQYAGNDVSCYFVQGNNDYFSDLPRELEITLGNKKCFLTHGHNYGVSMDVSILADEAKTRGCDVAFFGHTHRPFQHEVNGVMCVNPGSISYPRQVDRRPSFMLIEILDNGELFYSQAYYKES